MYEYVLKLIDNGKDEVFIKEFRKIVNELSNRVVRKLELNGIKIIKST